MNKDFPTWYKLVNPTPTPDLLERRWKGVESFGNKAPLGTLAELARVFFGLRSSDATARSQFNDALVTADPSFTPNDKPEELRVLAGATLVQCIDSTEQPYSASDAAALLLSCGSAMGLRDTLVPDIVKAGRDYLAERSVAARRTVDNEISEASTGLDAAVKALAPILKANGALGTIEKPLGDALGKVIELTEGLGTRDRYLREESNILWWLFGKYSRDLRKPLEQVSRSSLPFLIAKELADLTVEAPGPIAIHQFIECAFQSVDKKAGQKKIKIAEVITGIPAELGISISNADFLKSSTTIPDLCPIASSVRVRLELGTNETWPTVAAAAAQLDLGAEVHENALAFQVYEELLLLRLIQAG